MSLPNQTYFNKIVNDLPVSQQIIANFTHPDECLAAHLMFESSEVLAGVKPANLISLVNRNRSCGRNLYELWQNHKSDISIRIRRLTFRVLHDKPQSCLILSFDHKHLERHLTLPGIRSLLSKAGYDLDASPEVMIDELSRRIREHDTFPHEIGLFIGYPAKDVAAFMGLSKLPFTCQGPWKIYGDPAKSLELAEQYRNCRKKIGAILATGNLEAITAYNGTDFFCHHTDNSCHYHSQA